MAAGLVPAASDPEETIESMVADSDSDDDYPEPSTPRITGNWVKRGKQQLWRVMSVHVNNKHANIRRADCRRTLASLIALCLRDKVDIMAGDFNQAGWYLEECVYWAVRAYAQENNLPPETIQWTIPEPVCEIRCVLFNWPVDNVQMRMWYKEQFNFENMTVEDFGLRSTDQDTHVPQFLMLTKSPIMATEGQEYRKIFRTRSDEGKQKDKDRRNRKRYEQRQAKRQESSIMRSSSSKAASTSASSKSDATSAPAASSWEPIPEATQSKSSAAAKQTAMHWQSHRGPSAEEWKEWLFNR